MTLALWRSPEAKVLSQYEYPEPLLDLGCGFGEFATVFFENRVGYGLDINPRHLRLAGRSQKYQRLTLADARKMPYPDNHFQTILAMSVLEHISEVEEVFTQAYRVLKPGGQFILSFPTDEINNNLVGYQLLYKLQLTWLAKQYVKLYHRVFKHEVIMTKNDWLDLAQKTGFEIIDQQPALSVQQLRWFELTLLLSLPGKLTHAWFNIRNPFPWKWRQSLYLKLMSKIVQDPQLQDLNMVLVLRKNK